MRQKGTDRQTDRHKTDIEREREKDRQRERETETKLIYIISNWFKLACDFMVQIFFYNLLIF